MDGQTSNFQCLNNLDSPVPRSLIAGLGYKNALFDTDGICTWIIDGVRLSFNFDDIQSVVESVDLWLGLFFVETYTSNRIGRYRYMWTWDKADAIHDGKREGDGTQGITMSLGVGLYRGTGKIDNVGFVDFNPQKVNEKKAKSLIEMLSNLGCMFELARYDIAIDYPIDRDSVRLLKDRRKYECVVSKGMTEYLGQRSNPGRVKVYDKQRESNLDAPLTRVELTCAGKWGVFEVMEKLPVVYTYDSTHFQSLSRTGKVLALALKDLLRLDVVLSDREERLRSTPMHRNVPKLSGGVNLETYFKMCDKRTTSKIKNAIAWEGTRFKYSQKCVEAMIAQANSWAQF